MSAVSLNSIALARLMMGDPQWLVAAVAVAVLGSLLAIWRNRRRQASSAATVLRICGWLLLAVCLVNPMWSSSRPRRGANVVAVVADHSRSHLVATSGQQTRADVLTELLERGERREPSGWLNRIGQDFELRRYLVGDRLQQVDQYGRPQFDGIASSLHTALTQLQQRFEGQPLAGILLLSDGNATDLSSSAADLQGLAPVYPVIMPDDSERPDVAVDSVVVTQTAFDDAPVTLLVQPQVTRAAQQQVQVSLLDQEGQLLASQTQAADDTAPLRFQHRPTASGTLFYQVQTALLDADGRQNTEEVTLVNNQRMVAVDRGSQPRRVLYVSGRPNWEFKFLRRAVESDPQLQLVGLLRIARKEAKFDFRGREGERSNSLFRGFDQQEQEVAEEYDEPVLVRIGTQNADELRSGFPEQAADLFQYDAIILDDIEADFFLADQQKLIYDFVSRRGGGLLMLGGQESFRQGEYDRTPIGETLPVDLSRAAESPTGPVQFRLTRDGWLQPWIRLRADEAGENARLDTMPGFVTLNSAAFVRPGAVVMAEVTDAQDRRWPALVVQRFGKGRTAAVCIGDLWRWRLHEGLQQLRGAFDRRMIPTGLSTVPQSSTVPRQTDASAPADTPSEDLSDHARACRQMIRWLVADVPRRLDVSVADDPAQGAGSVRITARIRGRDFEPRENADVRFVVTDPQGRSIELTGEPADAQPGTFTAGVAARLPGPWKVRISATVTDEPEAAPLTAVAGWACQPDQDEMKSVTINRSWLESVAAATGGRVVELQDLDDFVNTLPESDAPLVETTAWPIWHQWWVFLTAVGCFAGDWTLRRRRGLP